MNLALGLSEQLLKNHDGSHKCGPFKNTPDNENVLTLHGVIYSKWMLEQEDIAESANTHLRNCFVFLTEQKTAQYCLWTSNEIISKTFCNG